jgi:hypothetical protein
VQEEENLKFVLTNGSVIMIYSMLLPLTTLVLVDG